MPKIAIDYSKTIIYKIVCKDLSITDCYVGHTIQFTKRKAHHKSRCNKPDEINYKVYEVIRNNGGWFNWSMLQVEEYCCNNKREAEARERYWIEELKSNLNMCIPSKPKSEWFLEHKEELQKYHQNYHQLHRSNTKCECGGSYSTQHKSIHLKTKKHQSYLEKI